MTEEIKKFRCEICNRDFASEEALGHHNSAKHSEVKKKETIHSNNNKVSRKKIKNWSILIIVLGLIIAGFVWGISGTVNEGDSCLNQPAKEINIGGHTNLLLHTHTDLEIDINGLKELIPANIGISTGIMRPIHTHDSSGELHVEGPCVRDFTLGEFFDIWGRDFNSTKIFDKTTENGELKVYVNGIETNTYRDTVLRDREEILIKYTSNT